MYLRKSVVCLPLVVEDPPRLGHRVMHYRYLWGEDGAGIRKEGGGSSSIFVGLYSSLDEEVKLVVTASILAVAEVLEIAGVLVLGVAALVVVVAEEGMKNRMMTDCLAFFYFSQQTSLYASSVASKLVTQSLLWDMMGSKSYAICCMLKAAFRNLPMSFKLNSFTVGSSSSFPLSGAVRAWSSSGSVVILESKMFTFFAFGF